MVSIDMSATGEQIRKLVKENNMTTSQLQGLLGLNTPQAIYKWYKGVCLPTVDNLFLLAEIFKCSIEDIVVRRN